MTAKKPLVIAVEVLEDGLALPRLICKGDLSVLYWTGRFLGEIHSSDATQPLRDIVEEVAHRMEVAASALTPQSALTRIRFEITGRGRCEHCRKKLAMKYAQCASCADARGP